MNSLKVTGGVRESVILSKSGLIVSSGKILIRKKEVAEMLSMTMGQVDKLHDTDSTFPKKIEFGETRQSMVRFFFEDIVAWVEQKKTQACVKYH